MKTYRWIVFILLGAAALSLSAFAPAMQPILQTPTGSPPPVGPPPALVVTPPPEPIPPTPGPSLPKPVTDARIELAQRLGVREIQIEVVNVQPTQWPDACMGIQVSGIRCDSAPVPGYQITLGYGGQNYVYHTDRAGDIAVLANLPGQSEQNILLHWTRVGGVAGFCNDLTVYQNGEVRAINCPGGVVRQVIHTQLPPGQFQLLQSWVNQYNSLSLQRTAPATVDNLVINLRFRGSGSQSFDPQQMRFLFDYAAGVYTWATSSPLQI